MSSDLFTLFSDLISAEFGNHLVDSESLSQYFNAQISYYLAQHFSSFPRIKTIFFDTSKISNNLSCLCYSTLKYNFKYTQNINLNRAHFYCYRVAVLLFQRIEELKLLLSDFIAHYSNLNEWINSSRIILFDGLGDPHNNCRSVMKLQSAYSETNMFYKPRFCDGEKLWAYIQSVLYPSSAKPFVPFRIEAENGFFEEAIQYQSFPKESHPKLYQNLGFNLFIAHISRHTDLWFDNLICSSRGFTFIDHENILQPINKPLQRLRNLNGSDTDPLLDLSLSVLMTMSLAYPMEMISASIFQDMGCLSHKSVYRWPHLVDDSSTWQHSDHLPSTHSDCIPILYTDHIKEGYLEAHQSFLDKKDIIYHIFNTFKSKTRVIRRSTFDYYDLQRALYSTKGCITGEQRWSFLVDSVSKSQSPLKGDLQWNEDLVLLSEVMQLDNGDIPYFYAEFEESNLFDAAFNNVGSFNFDMLSHLNNFLSPIYIEEQIRLISLSSHLHASICPSKILFDPKNVSYTSHISISQIDNYPLALFHKLSNYLNEFITGNTLPACIQHSLNSNCLFIGEPSHSGIAGFASSLEAFLDLFFIFPSVYSNASFSLVNSAFSFLDQFFKSASKQKSNDTHLGWSSLFYYSDLSLLKCKYNFFVDYINQTHIFSDKHQEIAANYLNLHKIISIHSSLNKLSVELDNVCQKDLLSSNKIKYLRLKVFQLAIVKDSISMTSIINDETLSHILAQSIIANNTSADFSSTTKQLLATACFAFDSGWKGWLNFGIFINLALLNQTTYHLDLGQLFDSNSLE